MLLQWYQNPDDAKYCLEWEADAEQNLAFASLELPTTASLLFFLSRGPVAGHIEIYRRPGRNQPEALVNVTTQYHGSEDLSRTKVCRMGSGEEHGVLLWVRLYPDSNFQTGKSHSCFHAGRTQQGAHSARTGDPFPHHSSTPRARRAEGVQRPQHRPPFILARARRLHRCLARTRAV